MVYELSSRCSITANEYYRFFSSQFRDWNHLLTSHNYEKNNILLRREKQKEYFKQMPKILSLRGPASSTLKSILQGLVLTSTFSGTSDHLAYTGPAILLLMLKLSTMSPYRKRRGWLVNREGTPMGAILFLMFLLILTLAI